MQANNDVEGVDEYLKTSTRPFGTLTPISAGMCTLGLHLYVKIAKDLKESARVMA